MKMNYSLIRTLFALVIGLILVCVPDKSAEYIVVTLGILFLLSGLIALIGHYINKSNRKKAAAKIETSEEGEIAVLPVKRFPIEAVGSALLGLWFIIDPTFFSNLLMIVLSVILILCGLQQIIMLLMARKWKKAGFGFYIVPVLILLAGLYALLYPNQVLNTVLVVIGVTCLVYAAVELLHWFLFLRYKPQQVIEVKDEESKD